MPAPAEILPNFAETINFIAFSWLINLSQLCPGQFHPELLS